MLFRGKFAVCYENHTILIRKLPVQNREIPSFRAGCNLVLTCCKVSVCLSLKSFGFRIAKQ
jgi:hypothetical protein